MRRIKMYEEKEVEIENYTNIHEEKVIKHDNKEK